MRGKTRKRKADAQPAPPPPPIARAPSPRPSPKRHKLADERGGTLKPEYAMWHRSSALARYGPRNSAIWQDQSPEPEDEAPHILSLINVHEAEQLFDLYHRHLHPHLPVLDLAHSAPSAVARRNNFLFNAICCVAARAFNVVLWERLREFAQYEMERLPKEKSIDVVQGHLVYTAWNLLRPDSFERDVTWLRVGLATRTAQDINLHRVAHLPQARAGLPGWMLRAIARTWLMAAVLDGTLSAQLGKTAALGDLGMYISILKEGGSADDALVAALAEWVLLLTRAMESFRADTEGRSAAAPRLVGVYRTQFRAWRADAEDAARRAAAQPAMLATLALYDNYAQLVVQSFALERALERGTVTLAAEWAEYQHAAVRLIEGFGADLSAPNLTRGCPDFVFTAVTYGAVSLLQALEPRLATLEPAPDRDAIFALARQAADMLARAAVTADHVPASQSMFISRLIQVRSRQPRQAQPMFDFGEMDFEAFGLSVAADDTMSMWPPLPNQNSRSTSPPPGEDAPTDLATWVAQSNLALPGPALGLGIGSFGGMLSHDFWQGVLTSPPPGMV
ncbi:hypothetical protein CspeluHIS016_0113750 [Cutaneotrichosporon spelunceum]|uniref:Transcription factor domain-containing protein n=1 Tax=Cutaneotrichosporon spelunceum TaxID=1672016 RepID=A0AAD3YAJ7_9TREE|nr:hypothetical protein CspeluHIS016_0113750 [Cutaneotrichosporon spelunceum]